MSCRGGTLMGMPHIMWQVEYLEIICCKFTTVSVVFIFGLLYCWSGSFGEEMADLVNTL